ncbi:hypothetical protein K6W26_22990 [Burkholderia sp. AU42008]|nr:hypothetical protein [Burkholderia sp. AU32357]MBY4875923.1 hypothetical protein [Burkholderia sp. AU42008]OXI44913.1 hypothetical protein CFB49_07595 [Burkholderia sp. AU17457]
MARFHCRCRHCDRRKVLLDKPDVLEQSAYPQCDCGERNWRIDKWMMQRNAGTTRCDCAGWWFPHRMGCFYCLHRKDGSDRLPGHPDFWTRDMTQEQHDALVARYQSESLETFSPLEAAA